MVVAGVLAASVSSRIGARLERLVVESGHGAYVPGGPVQISISLSDRLVKSLCIRFGPIGYPLQIGLAWITVGWCFPF